jgi:hypothetical protein
MTREEKRRQGPTPGHAQCVRGCVCVGVCVCVQRWVPQAAAFLLSRCASSPPRESSFVGRESPPPPRQSAPRRWKGRCLGMRTWPSTEAKSGASGHPTSRSSTHGPSIWACFWTFCHSVCRVAEEHHKAPQLVVVFVRHRLASVLSLRQGAPCRYRIS